MHPQTLALRGSTPPPTSRDQRLARSITATWWYTASAVIFFEFAYVLVALGAVVEIGAPPWAIAVTGIGGLLWAAAQLPIVLGYRYREESSGVAPWRIVLAPLIVSVAYAVGAGLASGLWVVAGYVLLQPLVLLNWPRGVRLRLTLVISGVLVALWIIDQRHIFTPGGAVDSSAWWMLGYFSVVLPAMLVLSLWWWDVLLTLDKARAAEAHLAATQERLRVATDVHDLQGHHLQVIALQLELAERLAQKDPDAALQQLRLARRSVDEARQGTRDLALRFRSVPLRDEIANAADLLRAAGTSVEASVAQDADAAPGSVLGPVIRETTTNALRHGGGRWARLSLSRGEAQWRYEIANDAGAPADEPRSGSGLDGIERRVAEAGGTVQVQREAQSFTVIVTVPATAEGSR